MVASFPDRPHFGAHGFDPYTNQDMQGIFYANGPNVKKGIRLPAIHNIDIYPFMAAILGLTCPPIDGSAKTLEKALKR